MKNILLSLFALLLISGCTSEPEPPKSRFTLYPYLKKDIKTATTEDLCGMNKFSASSVKTAYIYNATPEEINTVKQIEIDTMNELKRRKPFTKREWKLIKDGQVQVGMSKNALICSWGNPDRINRSSYGPDQYVYDGQYVYIRGNRVSAWN